MTREAEKRRTPPLEVRLQVALRQLVEAWRAMGRLEPHEPVRLELDHIPALVLRAVDPTTGHHIPHQHDPDALAYKTVAEHKLKTHGNGATNRGSDRGEAIKTRHLEEKRLAREAKAAEAAKLISPNSPNNHNSDIAEFAELPNSKPKRPIRSANRWPPKKVRPPYRRRGV